jgi:hypothetical protein
MARKQDLRIRDHHARPRAGKQGAHARQMKKPEREESVRPLASPAPPEEEPALRVVPPKKRRRGRSILWLVFSRLVLVGVLLVGGYAVWKNWEDLAPDSLVVWINDKLSGGVGGDGFPVDITGSTVHSIAEVEGNLALLNDTSFSIWNSRGGEAVRRSHSYTTPLMKTAGKYALVVEAGGQRLSLETRAKTVWTQTMEYAIISAAVSKNGTVAVITSASQSYNMELTVFNSRGKQLYQRSSGRQAVDVTVSPDGKRVAVVSVAADAGNIKSYVEEYRLDDSGKDPAFSKEGAGILFCAVAYLDNGRIAAVGDTALWMLDPEAGTIAPYGFGDQQLLGFSVGTSSAAVVTRSYGTTSGGRFVLIKEDGTASYTAGFTGDYRNLCPASQNGYYLLTGDAVQAMGLTAAGEAKPIAGDGRLVCSLKGKAVVLGLTALTEYELAMPG